MPTLKRKKKILIIGLDGASWDVFDDSLLKTCMPNLGRLKDTGAWSVLRSTEPPITPVAWTTCLTGCEPRTHGVIGMLEYSCREDALKIVTSGRCSVPNLWQLLSEQGYSVVSLNVPWTYPCKAVNGLLVAGFGSPGPKAQITYPPGFKDELLARIPDYEIQGNWNKLREYPMEKLNENLKGAERSFEQRVESAKLACEKVDWDVMMVHFQDTDTLSHRIWPFIDSKTRDFYPVERDRILTTFAKLDGAIGQLLEMAEKGSMIFVISDHGLCRKTLKVRPNVLLRMWGYLKPEGLFVRAAKQLAKNLGADRLKKKRGPRQPDQCGFEWSQSKAMMVTMALNGHVFLNVKGRQPNGIVEPGAEYEKLLGELKARLAAVVEPRTGEPVFSRVATATEVYGVSAQEQTKYGDLIIVPAKGVEFSMSPSGKNEAIVPSDDNELVGVHSYEGICIICGEGVKPGQNQPADIVDIAPTLMAASGAKLPKHMDGRVLKKIFHEEIEVEYQDSDLLKHKQSDESGTLADEEKDEITKRLSALGYIE